MKWNEKLAPVYDCLTSLNNKIVRIKIVPLIPTPTIMRPCLSVFTNYSPCLPRVPKFHTSALALPGVHPLLYYTTT